MAQNIFLQEYFKNFYYIYLLKKYIKYFSGTTQINLWKSNGMSDKNIENITKTDSTFATTFVNHHVLLDFLIKNNTSTLKTLKKY